MNVQIQTKHTGLIEVSEEAIFTFPRGMPGFESCCRFALFLVENMDGRPSGGGIKVYWLQALEDPEVVFNVVDANDAGITFQVMLSEDDINTLELNENSGEDIGILLILAKKVMGENIRLPLFSLTAGRIKPNLQGPIFVNMQKRLALQKVLLGMEITINVQGR